MTALPLNVDGPALDQLADELAERVAVRVADRLSREDRDGWLDTRAAAAYAGCSINSLHRAMAAREVRFSQNAERGKAYFRKAWLDEWRGL